MIFGTYRLPKNKVIELVYEALKSGYRHIDTAELYKNEKEVGIGINKAIKELNIKREDIFVTTKISFKRLKKLQILESINESLNKLNIKYIDCILLHSPINYIDNWKILSDIYNYTDISKKIKYIGVSNFSLSQLKNICSIEFPYVNQIEINPYYIPLKLINYCNKSNILVTGHSITCDGRILTSMNYSDIINYLSNLDLEIIITSSKIINIKNNFTNLNKKIKKNNINYKFNKEYIKYKNYFNEENL